MSLFQRLRIPGLSLELLTSFFGIVVAFLLPLHTRLILTSGTLDSEYWEYGTFALYAVDIPLVLFLLCGVMTITENHLVHRRIPLLAVLSLGIASVLAIDNAQYPATSFIALASLLIKGVGVAYVATHVPLRTTLIAWGCIASGVLQSVIACVQYAQQQVIAIPGLGMAEHLPQVFGSQVIQVGTERVLRAYGTLPHPNMLGGFLMVALLCAVSRALSAHQFERRLSYSAILILTCGVWTSLSRQAFLGCAVGIAFLVIRAVLKSRIAMSQIALTLLCVFTPIVFLTTLAPDVVSTRLLAQAPLEKNSINERVQFIEDTHMLIRDNGFWGIGLNQTTAALYTQDNKNHATRDVSTYQPVHVVPLLVWQEVGLFGLLAWLACVALPFIPSLRATESVFFASYLGLLTISLWDHYLWSLPFGILLFWVVWGLTLNPHTHTKK